MEQQIRDALTQAFAGAQVELETSPGGRYTGLLVWEGFTDEDSVDRHQQVRQVLTSALNGGAANVGILFTSTPGRNGSHARRLNTHFYYQIDCSAQFWLAAIAASR